MVVVSDLASNAGWATCQRRARENGTSECSSSQISTFNTLERRRKLMPCSDIRTKLADAFMRVGRAQGSEGSPLCSGVKLIPRFSKEPLHWWTDQKLALGLSKAVQASALSALAKELSNVS